MKHIEAAVDCMTEKNAGLLRSAVNAIKAPFFGSVKPNINKVGPMTRAEKFVADNITRGGAGRDSVNDNLRAWWSNPRNRQYAEEYMAAHPKAKPFASAAENLASNRKQFTEGTGRYAGSGTLAERIEAQRYKDLQASFSGFGDDANYLAKIQRGIERAKSQDASALMPTLSGVGLGLYQGSDEGIPGMLTGAAAGGLLGYGAGKGLVNLTRSAPRKKALKKLLDQRSKVLAQHDASLLGQKANFRARRMADFFLEKGRYKTLGERARFGRLGGAHIFGDKGEEVAARAMQGGLLGKGGLLQGMMSVDPRIGMNARLARLAFSKGDYRAAARYAGSTAVGGGMHAGKLGLMGGLPAYMVYSDVTGENPENKSFGERLGRSLGNNIAMAATFPLGAATWLPSMALGEEYSIPGQVANATGAIGRALSGPAPNPAQPPRPAVPTPVNPPLPPTLQQGQYLLS